METNKVFNYKGSEITFQKDKELMVNATQMAKPFGKSPWKWLELPSTKTYLDALSKNRSLAYNQLVTSVKGGNNPNVRGNWFHEDIALEFARWLSPDFAIWCNDRIKELLKHGATFTPEALEKFITSPETIIKIATQLKEEREEKERLMTENEIKQQQIINQNLQIRKSKPKVEYYDQVLQSKSTYTTNQIAKELGMSAQGLNKLLNNRHIVYKESGTWMLYAYYQSKGLTKTKTYQYYSNGGDLLTSMQTVWTEKGREFIHKVVEKQMVDCTLLA